MKSLFSKKYFYLGFIASLLFILGSTKAFAQSFPSCAEGDDPSVIQCGKDADCTNAGCPSCVHCNTSSGFCAPVDSDCQDISGGSVENTCRTAQCVDFENLLGDNPTGCDYEPISSSQNEDCINCSPYQANPNCGNGSCEQPNETFANCPIDCKVPGWGNNPKLPPTDSFNGACTLLTEKFFSFSGPTFNVPDSQFCEDGDICTSNVCTGGDCIVKTEVCHTTADGCCPAGCTPPVNGTTCPVNTIAATPCDPDCKPPVDCIPTPPPPPLVEPCLEGSGFNNNSGKTNCDGFSGCSLNKRATSSSNQGFLMLALAALSLGLGMKFRKRSN